MNIPQLSKTTTSINVTPGTPVNFTVILTIPVDSAPLLSFLDQLPALNSGSQYVIIEQSLPTLFTLDTVAGVQQINAPVGQIDPGTYFITIQANTTEEDAGIELENRVTVKYPTPGVPGSISIIIKTAIATVALCIHSSSMISLPNGQKIEISKLQPGQSILGDDGKPSNIIDVVPCWTRNDKCGDCIIFEKDSLGPNVPSSRFAVDAGHPICPPSNIVHFPYLKPAKFFVNNNNIYIVKWEDVQFLLPGENRRYDIIMKDDSCKVYIANGIIVKARQERKQPGYSYV